MMKSVKKEDFREKKERSKKSIVVILHKFYI